MYWLGIFTQICANEKFVKGAAPAKKGVLAACAGLPGFRNRSEYDHLWSSAGVVGSRDMLRWKIMKIWVPFPAF